MTERHLHDDPPTADQIAAAWVDIEGAVAAAGQRVPFAQAGCLVGLAGSVTTVAAMAMDLPEYDAGVLHGSVVSADEVADVTARLLAMTRARACPRCRSCTPAASTSSPVVPWSCRPPCGPPEADRVVVSETDILDGIVYSLSRQLAVIDAATFHVTGCVRGDVFPRLAGQEDAVAITIKDVADAAGVSTATVSRALRGLPNVDSATRDRIQRIATELDYVISPSASRLASGRTGSIAVITPYIARWYFSTVLSGRRVGPAERRHGPPAHECQHTRRPAPPAAGAAAAPSRRRRARHRAAAAGCAAARGARPAHADQPHRADDAAVPSVTIDDVLAGQIATQHLINLGHERIGVINGAPIISPYTAENDRYRGFENAMKDAGLPVDPMLEAYGYFTIPGGEQAMTALLTQKNPPTAVFAMSDEMAFGAMKAMRSHGLQPGKDISLVGVDGHDMSEFLDLTTVVQPVQDLGRIAAEALVLQLRSPGAEVSTDSIRLPTQLIVRGSTSPFKG